MKLVKMWNLPTLCPPANRSRCPPNESTPGEVVPGRAFLQFCEKNQTNPAIKIMTTLAIKIMTNPAIEVLTNLLIKIPKSYLILHFCRGRISFNFVQSDVWISDGLS